MSGEWRSANGERGGGRLLARLHELQQEKGYVQADDLRRLAVAARVPLHRLQELVSFYPHFRTTPPPRCDIALCRDIVCQLAAAGKTGNMIRQRFGGQGDVEVREVSCVGRCDWAPAALVNGKPVSAQGVVDTDDPVKLEEALSAVPRSSYRCDPYANPSERFGLSRELLRMERRQAIERIIGELKSAGLRGLGGAGFSTGTKWELVRQQTRCPKYVICNADESEPGTFKDREILARLPHLIIEAMLLAGLTVGAEQGILYIRHEYEPERLAFCRALEEAQAAGVVGQNILGSGFNFEIEVFVSPGGYILGEETALLEALEDRRGEPRNKPPFPGTHGLFGQPTLINNVETLAMVPGIVSRGATWWKEQGRPGFAGLKFMAVSGQVARPGAYEIPLGMPVRELIELAGGVAGGRALLAFAPGGASSNVLPARLADVPIDFAALARAGSMLGSGALIVVTEGADMVELAAHLVRFFRNESCGKCVPCRLGTQKAVEMLEDFLAGKTERLDLPMLQDLGETLNLTSICGLGQVALNPILSVGVHWPEKAGRSRK
jgi:NADH:ubiquinone oxidoreductase subunit F (NADH-binding)/NADH:ubiquinone oxidoreductase subunit E